MYKICIIIKCVNNDQLKQQQQQQKCNAHL